MFDMFSLTCFSCDRGVWHFFSLFFVVFKPDFDHGMMACHDMFDMFSSTCLSCNMGALHCFSPYFFCFQARADFDFDHWRLAFHDMFDMVSFTCLSCYMGLCRGRVWEVARLVTNASWRRDVTAPMTAQ